MPVEIILRDPGKWTRRLQTAVNTLTELTSTLTDRAIERVPANDEFKDEARILQRQFRESIQDMEIVLKRLQATEQAEPKLTVQQNLDNMAALFRDPTPPPLEPERAPAPMPVDLPENPYEATTESEEVEQPRRSSRIAAQPQPSVYTIPEGEEGDAVWGLLMDDYRNKIGGFVPAKSRKFIMVEYLDYLSSQDYYVGDMFNTPAIAAANIGKIFFPAELFKLDAEDRNFFNAKLNWVSKHPDAKIPAGPTRAETAILNNQREANLKIFNDMLMTGRAWWPRDFVKPPTAIPYKIKDTCGPWRLRSLNG